MEKIEKSLQNKPKLPLKKLMYRSERKSPKYKKHKEVELSDD